MVALFLNSIGRHLSWFACAFWPGSHDGAPLRPMRVVLLLIGYPLFCGVQLCHWLGFLIDAVCFPAYRQTVIRTPVFISGIPRSGTTFAHRSLAKDTTHFTTVSTWEAALAPSIAERKLLRALAGLDRRLGGLGARWLAAVLSKISGDFDAIHTVGLNIPEEDYLWLLPTGSCFILLMAFPFSPWLQQTAMLDRAPPHLREQLLDFYTSCLRKHLYVNGSERAILSKNAAFATWCPALLERFPDAKFLLCVREPEAALHSQLSSLRTARKLFATDPDGSTTARTLTQIFSHSYATLAAFLREQPAHKVAVIVQSDLQAAPGAVLRAAAKQLELPLDAACEAYLEALQQPHRSAHQAILSPEELDPIQIDVCLQSAYQTILQSESRIPLHRC